MRLSLAICVILLAGCMTPERRAEIAMERHGPYCDKLGFQRDTDQWRGCVVQQSQASDSAAMGIMMMHQQTRPRTCQMIGNAMQCF